jgi:hypothetical protein
MGVTSGRPQHTSENIAVSENEKGNFELSTCMSIPSQMLFNVIYIVNYSTMFHFYEVLE